MSIQKFSAVIIEPYQSHRICHDREKIKENSNIVNEEIFLSPNFIWHKEKPSFRKIPLMCFFPLSFHTNFFKKKIDSPLIWKVFS